MRHDHDQLVVSLHGHLPARQAARMGQVLADLFACGPKEVHVDIAEAAPAVGMGDVFVRVSALAQAHRVRVTVHRASAEQRAVLRRFGLGRVLLYSNQAPDRGSWRGR